MIALHGFFADAASVSESALAELSGCETEVDVHEIRCTALGEFGDRGMQLSDDLVAGVMGRLEGALPGSLSLVLDPDEALLWAQLGDDSDAIRGFVSYARVLLEGVAVALSEILERETTFEGAVLVEEPELAMLIQTHAPSDTLVFSFRVRLDVRDEALEAMSHLMIEPKYLAQLLSALSAAVH
jgi:hypothetical protein